MNDGHAFTIVGNSIIYSRTNQTAGSFDTNRFNSNTGGIWETDLTHFHFGLKPFKNFFCFKSSGLPLDSGIDILGILSDDYHVDLFRMNKRARGFIKIDIRTEADIEIKFLP